MKTSELSGKWVWIWNWPRCEGGDAGAIARRLRAAGCRGALVKAYDGPHWFNQGVPWREIRRALKAEGLDVGAWGYHYGADVGGEVQRALETIGYGEADLLVLDVEAEFKDRPDAAEALCAGIRQAAGPDYPLYFSSFAIARYHRSFPYETFHRYCTGAAPQVYWNAFRWPVELALGWTYEDHAGLGIVARNVFPVAGLYQEGPTEYPSPESVRAFARASYAQGSIGISFWSYEHMDEAMWQAVATIDLGVAKGEADRVEALEASVSNLTSRVDRLEDVVAVLGPPATTTARTYTVAPGDTLSSIAAALGLSDWRALYAANRELIGPDPDIILPGQALAVP